MHDKYAHLINPNFDLSAIVQDPELSVAPASTSKTSSEKKKNDLKGVDAGKVREEKSLMEQPFSSNEVV